MPPVMIEPATPQSEVCAPQNAGSFIFYSVQYMIRLNVIMKMVISIFFRIN